MENCDVQFCWWETVKGRSNVVLFRVWYHHWGIWQKEKMNPCENYLMTSFNFSLAFTLELSDLGQIKKQWLFPQESTPLPFLLARSEWHWLCTALSRRRETETPYSGVPLCCVLVICSGSVDFFFFLNSNRKCRKTCSILKEGVHFQ